MNKAIYSRLSVVVHAETAKHLSAIAQVSDSSVSAIVRGLIAEPAAVMAEHLGFIDGTTSPDAVAIAESKMDSYLADQYAAYLSARGQSHG